MAVVQLLITSSISLTILLTPLILKNYCVVKDLEDSKNKKSKQLSTGLLVLKDNNNTCNNKSSYLKAKSATLNNKKLN